MIDSGLPAVRRVEVSPATWDRVMVSLALAHGLLLVAMPGAAVIALGLWWNANTISHNFIHRPFFHHRSANRLFAVYLSVLLGFPHHWWRVRHLAHHAAATPAVSERSESNPFAWRLTMDLAIETAIVLAMWGAMAVRAPAFLLTVYLPGFAIGLALCALHGYYEHARGTTSYYGWFYNALFFNDGYHAEHHAHPGAHWSMLSKGGSARQSAWPAPLRWMELVSLESLERLALRCEFVQRFLLRTHGRAFSALLAGAPITRVAIVGGGLFPRTGLVLRELFPNVSLTIIDASAANLDCATGLIGDDGGGAGPAPTPSMRFVHARYPDVDLHEFDLAVFPLSFDGDRGDLYARPPAPVVIVHDWIWNRRGTSRVVSPMLLKRVNLLRS